MGKFKKGNVQEGAKLANPKTNKNPLIEQKKGGQNGVNKINPKKHSVKLPENIKQQVKNEKNKKNILEKANLNQIVTVKGPINKNQNAKLPPASVKNGKDKGDKKEFKNKNPQIKPTNNAAATKLQNNKRKAGPENNLKQQIGSDPKLPVPPSPKNKQKQSPLAQKEQVINPKVAAKGKPKKNLKKQEQKLVESQNEGEYEDQDLEAAFDEAKFNEICKEETITKIVAALKKHVASEVEQKKNQIFSDYKYILDVTCFKIPYCPTRMVKLNVLHPVRTDDDEVCLIVKDLQRGMRVDYEPTVHHYEDLLRKEEVEGIKAIVPFNQLRKEYGSYEMKAKLAKTYDYFLCDASIIGHVVGFLGKTFRNTRCTLHPVRFTTKSLGREIEKALHKTCYKQGAKGCMISIPVAHHKMSTKCVVENILDVISQLKEVYAGGLPNIRNIFVRTNMKGTSSMPLYVSLAAPKKTPFVVGPKEESLKKLKEKANKILEQFDVTLAGEILRKRQIAKNTESVEGEPKMKKKKEKNSNKIIEEAVKEKLLKQRSTNSQHDEHESEEEDNEEGSVDEDDEEGSVDEDDEEGSDEDGNGGEESDEQGSEEKEDEEENKAEGSDEDGSDEDGINEDESDEEGSGEEEIDALEFDSDDDSIGDIEAPSNESDGTEESDEDDDDEVQ